MVLKKIKASLIHLSISIIVFSLFFCVLYFYWFPEPYFTATGGWQGMRISAVIDLVLGPLLTLITYSHLKSKKELIFDYTFIVIIQFSALFWGIYTISEQHPVAISFWEDSFFTVPKKEINKFYPHSQQAKNIIKSGLTFYYVLPPKTIEDKKQLIKRITEDKIPPHFQIERYRNFKKHFSDIKKYSVDIQEIIDTNATMRADIKNLLSKNHSQLNDNVYLKLRSKYQSVILVFNKDAKLLGYTKAPLIIDK